MNVNISEFILEPVLFFDNKKYLSGTNLSRTDIDVIDDCKLSLELLFEQQIPAEYKVWSDFFASLISDLVVDNSYFEAQENISIEIKKRNEDSQKNNIKKRLELLKLKKKGLIKESHKNIFLDKVNDECYYILTMISIGRYINGSSNNNKLELIFDIFKSGLMPCGIKVYNSRLVAFNPLVFNKE